MLKPCPGGCWTNVWLSTPRLLSVMTVWAAFLTLHYIYLTELRYSTQPITATVLTSSFSYVFSCSLCFPPLQIGIVQPRMGWPTLGSQKQGTLREVCWHSVGFQCSSLEHRMSPTNFVHKWSTPQLLIHGSKDYRLPETEGIGAFHALQQLVFPPANNV